MPVEGARSQSWEEFAKPGAPELDFVFTVCDNAAKKVCPVWPGQPLTAHWGIPDPAAVEGTPEEIERAFRNAFMMLERRISLFLCLPLASLASTSSRSKRKSIASVSNESIGRLQGDTMRSGTSSRLISTGTSPPGYLMRWP
jgi:arsenate reductase